MTNGPGNSTGGTYCLTCFYDLRGSIASHRCPECGRYFNPDVVSSFSPTPHPERLKKFLKETAKFLADALAPPDLPVRLLPHDVVGSLSRRVAALNYENDVLRACVTTLSNILIDRGIMDEEQFRAMMESIRQQAPATPAEAIEVIADDSPDEALPTEALLELGRAAGTVPAAEGASLTEAPQSDHTPSQFPDLPRSAERTAPP